MDIKDGTTPQSPKILPFKVNNQQPQLSINIDDTDIRFLYLRYHDMVFRCCFKILRDEGAAQNVAHDVFEKIQLLHSNGKFHPEKIPNYISRMARNMSINSKKRARNELIKIYDMAADRSINWFKDNWEQGQEILERGITENGYYQDEAEKIVKAILDEQDEITRKIYLYKYHEGMTLKQIGEAVGLSQSAVHKRIKKLEEQVKVKMGRTEK
jgi:RNA polymerase sigma-70 factor (ECF subfamily)